jgi:hypothetical protein
MRMLRGFIDELIEAFPGAYGQKLDGVESQAEQEIDKLMEGLNEGQLKELLETVRQRRGLVDTNAAYGNEVVSTSKQILAFGGAGIGLVAAVATKLADLPPQFLKLVGLVTLFYLNLTGLSLFTILQFVWLTRFRYPFLYLRKIGNTIPFFYYQAISPEVPRSTLQTAEEKYLAVELYAKDFVKFVKHLIPDMVASAASDDPQGKRVASVDTDKPDLRLKRRVVRDELQQYFLLISYQGYVNQFEVRMNNQFFYGVSASIVSTIVLAVYVFGFR